MSSKRWLTALGVLAASTFALALVGAAPVRADGCDDTWTGASGSNWSVLGNWSGGVPIDGQTLCFPAATANLASMDDDLPQGTPVLAGLSFSGSGGQYQLSGNQLSLDVGASISVAADSNVTISDPLDVSGTVTITGSGQLTLSGAISGAGGFAADPGTDLEFGDAEDTFSGGVTASDAKIVADPRGGWLGTGPIVIQNGLLVNPTGLANNVNISGVGPDAGLECSNLSGTVTLAGTTSITDVPDTMCFLHEATITGPYGLVIQSTMDIQGDSSYSGGTVLSGTGVELGAAGASPLGSGPVTVEQGTALGGSGTVGDVTSTGTIWPAVASESLSPLTVGALTTTGGTVETSLCSPTAYDYVIADGPITIGSSTALVLSGCQNSPAAGTYTIIRNRSGQPVAGTFDGLPEGASFTAGGTTTFYVTYQGNGEDDVVISSVPPETPTPITMPSPIASPYPLATPLPLATPTATPGSSPHSEPSPSALTAHSASPSGGAPTAGLLLAAAALVLIAIGLSLLVPGPIRRRVTAWRHRAS
jgi:hypothetical protein